MTLMNKGRATMTLFSEPDSLFSHRVRFVIAEKDVAVEIIDVNPAFPPEDLLHLNPTIGGPTLSDRDLVLYDTSVICDYLDERYPHPPLMPVDPVSRAQLRLALFRIHMDWYSLVPGLESTDTEAQKAAADTFRQSLIDANEVFESKPFFLSEDLTLVDCALAPLLWRLPKYGVALPAEANAVLDYAERLLERESFLNSLSEEEKELRE